MIDEAQHFLITFRQILKCLEKSISLHVAFTGIDENA